MTHLPKKELEKRLKSILQEPATIHVGKRGVTPSLIEETANQLELNDAVKIRVLKSLEHPELILQELAQLCNAVIWKKIGRVGILVVKSII